MIMIMLIGIASIKFKSSKKYDIICKGFNNDRKFEYVGF